MRQHSIGDGQCVQHRLDQPGIGDNHDIHDHWVTLTDDLTGQTIHLNRTSYELMVAYISSELAKWEDDDEEDDDDDDDDDPYGW